MTIPTGKFPVELRDSTLLRSSRWSLGRNYAIILVGVTFFPKVAQMCPWGSKTSTNNFKDTMTDFDDFKIKQKRVSNNVS